MVRSFCATNDFKKVEQQGSQWKIRLFPESSDDGLTTFVEFTLSEKPTESVLRELQTKAIEDIKATKLSLISFYDKSSNVNSFKVNDEDCWLDKTTRMGLANSLAVEKSSGKAESTIYLNGVAYTKTIEELQTMLQRLELYAVECFRVTEAHEATLSNLSTYEDIKDFDIQAGYPEILSFVL